MGPAVIVYSVVVIPLNIHHLSPYIFNIYETHVKSPLKLPTALITLSPVLWNKEQFLLLTMSSSFVVYRITSGILASLLKYTHYHTSICSALTTHEAIYISRLDRSEKYTLLQKS